MQTIVRVRIQGILGITSYTTGDKSCGCIKVKDIIDIPGGVKIITELYGEDEVKVYKNMPIEITKYKTGGRE